MNPCRDLSPVPSLLSVVNQGALAASSMGDPLHHGRMRHIDFKLHFRRHHIAVGVVVPSYVPSADNAADPFTKAPPPSSFLKFRDTIGVRAASRSG